MLALGTVVAIVFGSKIISGIKSFATALKSCITAAQGLNSALGLIGIAATAISAIIGVVQGITQAQKEARQETINTWSSMQDQANELANLAAKYKELNSIASKTEEQENEYATVQENIIELLGQRANALADLKEGTEEYKQVVEELTEAELLNYAQQAQAAANAAQKEFNSNASPLTFSNMDMWGSKIDEEEAAYQYLIDKGIAGAGKINTNLLYDTYQVKVSGGTFQGYDDIVRYLDELYKGGYGDSKLYSQLYEHKTKYEESINKYIEALSTSESFNYLYQSGAPKTQENIDSIVNSIMSATGATETWRDEIENIVIETTNFKEKIAETNGQLDDQIKKIEYLSNSALEDLINSLNEIKNAEEESLSLEEKKQSVLEAQNNLLKAQQALEEAKNNRSIKVFNAATGQYEWAVDETKVQEAEKEVVSAEESFQSAIEDFSEYIKNQAWNSVVDELKSGNATNDSILAILTEWKNLATSNQVADTAWLNSILEIIKTETGIDLSTENSLSTLLRNTTNDIINNAALAAKILQPTSNAELAQYMQANGIMYNASIPYSATPPQIVSNASNNSTNTTDNSITINGVKIGNDMLQKPLIEVLRAVNNLVPNNG